MHKVLGITSTAVVALIAAAAAPAVAQTAPAAPTPGPAATAPAPADTSPLEGDVIVTAQKRSQRLIDVPLSITAIGGGQLSASGITSTRDLAQAVPGLVTASIGLSFQPAIRGVSSTGTYAGDEANVSLYIDDVYVPAQFSGLFQLADIERIEVLKGPQGTLFGRNATGGAIRVVTRDPSSLPALEATASYGFATHERRFTAYGTTGLTDTLAASVSGYYDQDDGYLHNVTAGWTGGKLGSLREWTVRGKLKWEPSSSARFVLAIDGSNSRNSASYSAAIINNDNLYRNQPGYINPTGKWDVSSSFDPILNVKGFGVSLNGTVDLGFASLKSVSGYRNSRTDFVVDSDRSNLNLGSVYGHGYTRSYSQELDLSSDDTRKFSWILGGYAYHANSLLGFRQLFRAALRLDAGSGLYRRRQIHLVRRVRGRHVQTDRPAERDGRDPLHVRAQALPVSGYEPTRPRAPHRRQHDGLQERDVPRDRRVQAHPGLQYLRQLQHRLQKRRLQFRIAHDPDRRSREDRRDRSRCEGPGQFRTVLHRRSISLQFTRTSSRYRTTIGRASCSCCSAMRPRRGSSAWMPMSRGSPPPA